jgi:hypothetical protein
VTNRKEHPVLGCRRTKDCRVRGVEVLRPSGWETVRVLCKCIWRTGPAKGEGPQGCPVGRCTSHRYFFQSLSPPSFLPSFPPVLDKLHCQRGDVPSIPSPPRAVTLHPSTLLLCNILRREKNQLYKSTIQSTVISHFLG